jgi:hypothetical protein
MTLGEVNRRQKEKEEQQKEKRKKKVGMYRNNAEFQNILEWRATANSDDMDPEKDQRICHP